MFGNTAKVSIPIFIISTKITWGNEVGVDISGGFNTTGSPKKRVYVMSYNAI